MLNFEIIRTLQLKLIDNVVSYAILKSCVILRYHVEEYVLWIIVLGQTILYIHRTNFEDYKL